MKRAIIMSLGALALWGGVGVNFAAAQFGTLGQQPRFNPFINPPINTPGGFSTYGVLQRPFDPARPNDPVTLLQRLNAEGTLQALITNQTTAQTGLTTGHSVTFLDYGGYFPLNPNASTGNYGGIITAGQNFGSFNNVPAGLQSSGGWGSFLRR
jgi:hypothetical protein